MRKLLVVILIILGATVLWLWRGRDLVTLADRFKTIEANSQPITAIVYNGEGSGGSFQIDDVTLSLNEVQLSAGRPNVGTTLDGQLALSYAGRVFAFGHIPVDTQQLRATPDREDAATLSVTHSALAWPNFFEVNYMTGNSPKWKRYIYRKLTWTKANGAKLKMVWRYEQFFYANDGWVQAFMTRPETTGLIRVEISNASR
ncbi:MAG TPA: hypothetical protein VKS98_01570 [Chthoniobacterales bacterium]|nr:hypothetical protein [Chthoniobacterales bacterium]